MDVYLLGILPPHPVIRLHGDHLDHVQGNDVKLPHRLVILRRISCRHDDPPLGDAVVTKGLALEKLQHGRRQSLGHEVDFINKQNPLRKPRVGNLVVNGRHDLAHGVLGDGTPPGVIDPVLDKGQADGALPGMVSDGVGHQADAALLGNLLHDLGLSYARRADEQHRPLPDGGDLIGPVPVPQQIRLNGVLDLFLGSLNIQSSFPPSSFQCSRSRISFMAQDGTDTSSY